MSYGALFRDPVLTEIAEAHGKTPAQVILRWHIQKGFSVIPGATNHGYITENVNIFDFELTPEEMESWNEIGVTDEEILRKSAYATVLPAGCCKRFTHDELFDMLKETM